MDMKAARIVRPKEFLEVQELETPMPKNSQVLVKVNSSGVCKYPLTPGHEIAGIVESMGEEAEGFNKNEKVIIFPWIGEGLCPACRVGQENLCDKPRSV